MEQTKRSGRKAAEAKAKGMGDDLDSGKHRSLSINDRSPNHASNGKTFDSHYGEIGMKDRAVNASPADARIFIRIPAKPLRVSEE